MNSPDFSDTPYICLSEIFRQESTFIKSLGLSRTQAAVLKTKAQVISSSVCANVRKHLNTIHLSKHIYHGFRSAGGGLGQDLNVLRVF